jgi:glycosyltransferase involved in cell wall biosynthesis
MGRMPYAVAALYGLFALVALSNLLLMRRPRSGAAAANLCVLVPARDEAANLERLIPALREAGPDTAIYVFDDESTDGTGDVALRHGAKVIRPRESLPPGWTGKNRACHELAKAAAEDSDADWYLFLDADTYPAPDLVSGLSSLIRPGISVVTGIPKVLPGRAIEPLFLAWVGWIILATNPFGVVSRTGIGHNRFKNGQVHLWRRDIYTELWPNERVKGRIMEDVSIGRLLAQEGIRVEVANLSPILSVKMYDHWRETLDGMSKNSYEVTDSYIGTSLLALLLLSLGFLWALAGPLWWLALGLFVLSGACVLGIARTAWWILLLMPIVPVIGAFTMVRSMVWRKQGRVRWKGREYGGG